MMNTNTNKAAVVGFIGLAAMGFSSTASAGPPAVPPDSPADTAANKIDAAANKIDTAAKKIDAAANKIDADADVDAEPRPSESLETTQWGQLHTKHGCAGEHVLCINGDGNPILDPHEQPDALPKNIAQGTQLNVQVISCTARYADATFSLAIESQGSGDQLFRVDYTATDVARQPSPTSNNGLSKTCDDPDQDYSVLGSATLEVPGKSGRLSVIFTREALPDLPKAHRPYAAKIIRGLYFLDIAFALPFVFGGERKIAATEDPSADLRRLQLEQDFRLKPAVMLHVFPGGRRLGAMTSFSRDRDCDPLTPSLDEPSCKALNIRRGFANSLGLQLGMALDSATSGSDFFVGGMFEPVVGLNFGVGLALVKGEYYRDGFTDGQLVGPDVNAGHWGRDKFMARPYFSISVSLDIIRNINAALKRDEITSLTGK